MYQSHIFKYHGINCKAEVCNYCYDIGIYSIHYQAGQTLCFEGAAASLKTLIYPGNVVTERTVCSTSKAHSYTHSHQGVW